MEPAAILSMTKEAPTKRGFVMYWIVADDNLVMRVHLRLPRPHLPKDKGKLPIWIYEPTFKADPGHRKKTVAKKFYQLATVPVATSRVIATMAERCKKNWG